MAVGSQAADVSSAAQIFLRSDALLERELTKDDIKRRLLGHWGTCPGLNFVYAHSTALLRELEIGGEQPEWLFVTGVSPDTASTTACVPSTPT